MTCVLTDFVRIISVGTVQPLLHILYSMCIVFCKRHDKDGDNLVFDSRFSSHG